MSFSEDNILTREDLGDLVRTTCENLRLPPPASEQVDTIVTEVLARWPEALKGNRVPAMDFIDLLNARLL